MNKDNASKWIGLGSAMLQGKTIQLLSHGTWRDIAVLNTVSFDPESYRIKPDPKMQSYRVALFKRKFDYFTQSLDNLSVEEKWESDPGFVQWLTDRIEYELPE